MPDWLHVFLGDYAPHGLGLQWQPSLVWTLAVSDLLIAAAFLTIALALVGFTRRRDDVAIGGLAWLFALFICAGAASHLMQVWNLWHGDFGMEAAVKLVTALASVPTAILLWRALPRARALPSPGQLQAANTELARLVHERDDAVASLTAEIAQRERAEEALVQAQKIEAVGQLTGGIAHDFNNLLQAVGGNLDLIRRAPEDPARVARWADSATRAVERGVRLTSQLLSFSRTQRLALKPVHVDRLVEGLNEMIQRSVGPAIELRTISGGMDCTVMADPTQLELALLNLAINARDAMPDGGKLIVSTRRIRIPPGHDELEHGNYCEIGVSDTGLGMPPEVAARALDPFFTTKGVGKGTGLGLSMAFGMAKQSGGALRLKSVLGEGTTVTLLLRLARDEEERPDEAAMAAAAATLPDAPRPDLHVVLVDDDPDVRGVVEDTLDTLGYRCEAYAKGTVAVAALERSRPDLLILDFAMPDLNGAEVARQVRQLYPDLPIIFISGYADSDALDGVADDHSAVLRKPFQASELARLVAMRIV